MQIDLTWNLFLTAILIPALGWLIRRWIKKSDDLTKAHHDAIVLQLDNHCKKQETLHSQIDARFWKHAHTMSQDGKTTEDIIIRGDASGI